MNQEDDTASNPFAHDHLPTPGEVDPIDDDDETMHPTDMNTVSAQHDQ